MRAQLHLQKRVLDEGLDTAIHDTFFFLHFRRQRREPVTVACINLWQQGCNRVQAPVQIGPNVPQDIGISP